MQAGRRWQSIGFNSGAGTSARITAAEGTVRSYMRPLWELQGVVSEPRIPGRVVNLRSVQETTLEDRISKAWKPSGVIGTSFAAPTRASWPERGCSTKGGLPHLALEPYQDRSLPSCP